ncbi:MAG: hypothetical protein O6922_07085, partial [Chloroflexi bacterium]|nr:hypothetical protein [Chloroflexota bacterium]
MNEQERRIREADKRRHIGVVLVVLGVLLFAVQLIDMPNGAVTRMVIGAAFVVGYLYRREYGLLIPGCILLGLGLGRIGSDIWNVYEYGSIGLGVGFLAIYVVDRLYRGTSPWWPLVPGLILVAKGLAHGELSVV